VNKLRERGSNPLPNEMKQLTDKQKQNVERILAIAKRHLDRNRREASPSEAIGIANREWEMAEYFRREAGIDYESLAKPGAGINPATSKTSPTAAAET
jgi:hypothetical protein